MADKRRFPSKTFLVSISLLVDACLIFSADLAAFFIRFGFEYGPLPRVNRIAWLGLVLPIIVLRLLCFYIYGLYNKPKYKSTYDIVLSTVKATTVSTGIIIVVAFMARSFAYPRSVILISWALTIPLIVFWRLATKRIINWILKKNYFVSQVLIIGTCREAQRIATRLVREAAITRKLVGFINPSSARSDPAIAGQVLGGISDISALVKEKAIDEVVIASPLITRQEILAVINEFSGTDVIFRIVPGLYEATIGTMAGSPTEDIPLISPTAHQKVAWYPDLKRLIDTFGAVAGLIVSFPFMLGAAVLIKLTSPGPVIYRQVRAGLHGKIFTLYKFRTMIPGSEAAGAAFAADDDPRITRFGGFLRRFRLDELPQLYNVLINDMSLVGPRPERPVFIRQLMEEIPFYAERLAVKPGLTGWAQIVHGYASTPEEHRQKLLYDIFYIENMSPALDFLIIFRTVSVVLRGSGSR
ncbi:MAG TPA: sugar transferase [bacterium]|nr:sugar transferase [bacterium]HPQ66196.1 sugar transferase [bacterium]